MTPIELQALMYAALDSQYGQEIVTSSTEQLKTRLYVTRADARKQGNLDFDCLSFRLSPTTNALWIVKKKEKKEKET